VSIWRAVAVLAGQALAASALAVPVYTVTDLGTLGGFDTFAFGLNDLGQVVGASRDAAGGFRPFVWTAGGGMTGLGTLGGNGVAYAINNSGRAVGTVYLPGDSAHAALWSAGSVIDLGTLAGASSSEAFAINASGQAVGYSRAAVGSNRPTFWQAGSTTATELATASGAGLGMAINDSGQIAGVSFDASGQSFAARWSDSSAFAEKLDALPGQTFSQASAINNAGVIAGTSSGGAILWNGSPMILNGLTFANGIGPNSEVVGRADIEAAIWTAGSGLVDLNTRLDASGAGWRLVEARAINALGQIVGYGLDTRQDEGSWRAFLLTPCELCQAVPPFPVPEPTTYAMLLAGLLLMALTGVRLAHARGL